MWYSMRTRLYDKIIEFYWIFGDWGFRFSRLIKLAEHILLNSPYYLLAIYLAGFSARSSNKEIEADEQSLKGYYPLAT